MDQPINVAMRSLADMGTSNVMRRSTAFPAWLSVLKE
jgi:hypothetical protein